MSLFSMHIYKHEHEHEHETELKDQQAHQTPHKKSQSHSMAKPFPQEIHYSTPEIPILESVMYLFPFGSVSK